MNRKFLTPSLIALSLAVLPVGAFADTVKKTTHREYHRVSRSEQVAPVQTQRAAANYEDSRYQKWASMTAEERDLARQRGEISYKDWNDFQRTRDAQAARNKNIRGHRDVWAGKTAEEKDAIKQRNSVYERNHPKYTGHHPDKWAGKTAEEKDVIEQRNSVPANKVTAYDKNGKPITRHNYKNRHVDKLKTQRTVSRDNTQ